MCVRELDDCHIQVMSSLCICFATVSGIYLRTDWGFTASFAQLQFCECVCVNACVHVCVFWGCGHMFVNVCIPLAYLCVFTVHDSLFTDFTNARERSVSFWVAEFCNAH